MSSTLTMDTSSGTDRPRSRRARITPKAISSLATKTAVTSGIIAMICPCR